MMLVLAVKLKVKPEKREEFLEKARIVIDASNQEEACIHYHAYEDFTEPNTFLFYEEWRGEDGWNKHMMTEHVQLFNQQLPDLLVDDADGRVHTVTYTRPLNTSQE